MKICTIEGCLEKSHSKGMCPAHYLRNKKGIDMTIPIRKNFTYKKCIVEGCNRCQHSRKLCTTHYSADRYKRLSTDPSIIKFPCSVKDCNKYSTSKGLCKTHYGRLRKGIPLNLPIKPNKYTGGCKIEGCNKPHDARGYCKNHLNRQVRIEVWTKILEIKGNKCKICNNTYHFSCYDLHHRDPSLKDFTISTAISGKSIEKILKEVEKCDLLCSNCHRLFHYDNYKMGTKSSSAKGRDIGSCKLKEDDIRKIRQMKIAGERTKDIARTFNVSIDSICRIIRKKTWKHVEDILPEPPHP